MNSFASIISLWSSAEELAADLEIPGNNPGGTVRAWKQRDNIPPAYWSDLVSAAVRRGFHDVTFEALALIASRRRGAA